MMDLNAFGRILLVIGGLLILLGLAFLLAARIPLLGHLPGDIRIERENWGCYVPLATSLLLSLLFTLLINLILRFLRR